MLAVRCNTWMPYGQLNIEDVPAPTVTKGEVRIAVHYAGMSFATSLVTEGRYQRKPPLPFSPGTEIAGVIDQVAPDVTRLKVGDRVTASVDWGGHAEFAVTDASTAYRLPDELPFDIAPQLPQSYGTSFAALSERARVQAGETVLIHGAAGAVGLAAVELAKALGATVIATASTEEKLALARAHGADQTVILPSATALDELRGLLPRGADVIFDPIGGDVFDLSLRCVANSGRILVIGFAGGRIQQIPANIILVKDVAILGFNFGSYIGWTRDTSRRSQHGPEMGAVMERIFTLYHAGKIKPFTSHRFPLREFRAAMEAVLGRRGMGKVVLEMPIASRRD
ncbi:MAG: NADPH:quinone oxidoreductase family protein [Acetobacteraceae bacterium]|nr:NADPH:quinone oxidoreductase family protein [Acetobacteraceae bacterium]